MNSSNYIVIQGWMCNELELKGNELLIFSLIHGFSQDGVSKYYGGRKYIADTFNISLPTVDKALQSLLDKEYIVKHISGDYINPDSYWVNSEVVKKLYEGSKETLRGGSKETLHDITNNKKHSNMENNISKDILLGDFEDKLYSNEKPKKQKKKNLYEKCLDYIYEKTDDLELQDLLVTFLKMRLEVRDKPLYTNMWRGMVNKLFTMSDKIAVLCDIVQQSIDKGWLSFYALKQYSDKKRSVQSVSSEFGEVRCDKIEDEEMVEDEYF